MTTSNFQKHTSSNFLQQYLIANFYRQLIDQACSIQPITVLDVGCGEGFTLQKLQDHNIGQRYFGVDISSESISLAKQLCHDIEFLQAGADKLPFPDKNFDLVLCNEVLEHLTRPELALKEISRVSKKFCLFSVPNEPWFQITNFLRGKYLRTFGNHPEHINHWSFQNFQEFLKDHQFQIINAQSPFAWTLVTAIKT